MTVKKSIDDGASMSSGYCISSRIDINYFKNGKLESVGKSVTVSGQGYLVLQKEVNVYRNWGKDFYHYKFDKARDIDEEVLVNPENLPEYARREFVNSGLALKRPTPKIAA